jgi:hypothetical protein
MDGIIEDGNKDEGAASKSMPKGETAKGGHRLWGGSVRMFGDVWSPVVWLSIIFDSLLHDVPIFCIPTLLYHFIPLLTKVHSLILINDEDYKLPHAQRSYQWIQDTHRRVQYTMVQVWCHTYHQWITKLVRGWGKQVTPMDIEEGIHQKVPNWLINQWSL